MFVSTETYRVDRTKSTMDKNKFGDVVCAFATDMSNYDKTGYVF